MADKVTPLRAATGKKFWEVRNAAEGVAELYVYGDIIFEDYRWTDSDVSAESMRNDLEAAGNVHTINMYVASLGGSFWQALAICAMLDRHPATINGFVDGFAASAATLLLAVADTVSAPSNALLLYHPPLAGMMGYYNADNLRVMADDLDRLLPSMLATYQNKNADMTLEQMTSELFTDAWMTASEAAALGLVDVVSSEADIAAHAYASEMLDAKAFVPEPLRAALVKMGAEDEGDDDAGESITDEARAEMVRRAEESKSATKKMRERIAPY